MKTKEQQQQQQITSTQGLFRDGVLVDLDVSYWGFQKALTPGDLGIDPKDVPDIVRLGSKFLFPKIIRGKFRNIEARARYYLDQSSFSFPVGTTKFVPKNGLPRIIAKLEELKAEFKGEMLNFIGIYAEQRDAMLVKYPKFRKALEGAYPPVGDIASRFGFSWSIYALSLVTDIDSAEIARYQQELKQKVDGFISEAINHLRGEVVDTCRTLLGKLDKGEVITFKSVDAIKNVIEKFSLMNFYGDYNIERSLAELKSKLPQDNRKLDNAAAQSLLSESLRSVVEQARSVSDIAAVTGEYKRKIVVRKEA